MIARRRFINILYVFLTLLVMVGLTSACAQTPTEEKGTPVEEKEAEPTEIEEKEAEPTEVEPSGEEEEVVTVKLLYLPGPEADAMAKVLEYYNENVTPESGVQGEIVYSGRDNWYAKVESMMAAGSDEVDTFQLDTSRFGKYLGYLEPMNEHFKDPEFNPAGGSLDTFIPSIIDFLSVDNVTYCMPTDFSIHFLYYRTDYIEQLLTNEDWQETYKDLAMEKLGKEMEPKHPDDWDWDDFLATAYFFSQAHNPESPTKYGTMFAGRHQMTSSIMLFSTWVAGHGGQFFDFEEGGIPTIDTPEVLETMKLVDTLREDELIPPDFITYEFMEANEAFGTGNIAFMIHWNAGYNFVNDPEQYPETAGKTGLTHTPAGPDGPKTFINSLCQAVNKNSSRMKETFTLLGWLAKEESMKMYAKNGGIPAVSSVLAEMADEKPDFLLLAEHADKYSFRIGNNITTPLEIIGRGLAGAWVGDIPNETALESTQEDLMIWWEESQ